MAREKALLNPNSAFREVGRFTREAKSRMRQV
jgi:hypothetical protein